MALLHCKCRVYRSPSDDWVFWVCWTWAIPCIREKRKENHFNLSCFLYVEDFEDNSICRPLSFSHFINGYRPSLPALFLPIGLNVLTGCAYSIEIAHPSGLPKGPILVSLAIWNKLAGNCPTEGQRLSDRLLESARIVINEGLYGWCLLLMFPVHNWNGMTDPDVLSTMSGMMWTVHVGDIVINCIYILSLSQSKYIVGWS